MLVKNCSLAKSQDLPQDFQIPAKKISSLKPSQVSRHADEVGRGRGYAVSGSHADADK